MKQRILELTLLVAALIAGYQLRVIDLELYRMSPDEGNYLYSAGVDHLEQDAALGAGLAADKEWLFPRYYPHSYLHQLAIRWSWRLGKSAIFSVRIDSVLLGLLTSLVVYLFSRRALAGRHWAAGFAAGVIALQCLHIWYSRTGWGATGCTAFFAVYLALGYELVRSERRWVHDLWIGVAMSLAALLAFGWHEMIVVHVGGMGLFILLHHIWGGPGFRGSGLAALPHTLQKSPKAWAALVSALPIVVLFAFLLTSDFARQHWINFEETKRPGVLAILNRMFVEEDLQLQFAWPVLLLAVFGYWQLRKSNRLASRYLMTALLSSSLIFLFFFKDAYLVRIYLPTAVVIAVLAGNGFGELVELAGERWRVLAGAAGTALLFSWMAMVSYRTIHDWKNGDELFFEPRFHHLEGYRFVDARNVHDSTFAILRERLEPNEVVGVDALEKSGRRAAGEFSILFRLRDAGFRAEPFAYGRPRKDWPRFLMGVKVGMKQRGHSVEGGGVYREIGADKFGRMALFELESRP